MMDFFRSENKIGVYFWMLIVILNVMRIHNSGNALQ